MRLIVLALAALLLSAAPASPAPRLLVVGDSLAVGLYATAPDRGYAMRLADTLGADLTVLRAATVQAAAAALPGVGGSYATIVVELGLNDASPRYDVSLADYLAQYSALLDALAARWPDARILVTTLWSGQGETDRRAAYSAGLQALAQARGRPLADVAAATRGRRAWVSAIDGWHPNDMGHAAIAATIADALAWRVYLPAVASEEI